MKTQGAYAAAPGMSTRYVCQICHNEIAHLDAECQYCKSRSHIAEGASPRILTAVFGVMVAIFAATALFTGSFKEEGHDRGRMHFDSANALMAEGHYEEAIEEYRDAMLYSRTEPAYQLGLAQALFATEQYPETENHLVDLLGGNPTSGIVNRRLAQLAREHGRLDEAASYFRTAVYGEWEDDEGATAAEIRHAVHLELADLLEQAGRTRELAAELKELVANDPASRDLRHRLAAVLLDSAAYDEALEHYAVLLESDEADRGAMLGRAEAEFQRGNYLSARTYYTLANSRASDEATSERIALCDLVIALDPTRRGIVLAERVRRSRSLVERVREFALDCVRPPAEFVGPAAPLPADLDAAVSRADEVIQVRRPALREDAVEDGIALAEEIWSLSQPFCLEGVVDDDPLGLVMAKLAR